MDATKKEKVQYRIFQFRDTKEYSWMPWKFAKENGFNIRDYHEVYSGEIEQKNCLENLFRIFNLNHPADFKGHSLSVSDVVGIKTEGNDHYYWYYCDSFGWEDISDEIEI